MGRRKVRILTIILAIVIIIAVALAALFYYTDQKLDASMINATNIQTELTNNTVTGVYVAKTDIKAGETITDEAMAEEENINDASEARDEQTAGAIITNTVEANVYMSDIYSSLARSNYITEEQLGSVAVVDIPAETPIMTNMVEALTITQDTREYEINAVNLMVDQQNYDYIDVRIAFPNGEEYVVLSKKKIENLSLAYSNFRTYMTEAEMLTYRSAVCDAYQTTGTYLYATRYVEGNLQDAATVNYLVRSETIDLMKSDPNVYTIAEQTLNASARLALEVRLGQLTEEQLAAVADGLGIEDTARNSVLSQNVDNNSAQISTYDLDDTTSSEVQSSDADDTSTDTDDTSADTSDSEDVISSPFVSEDDE